MNLAPPKMPATLAMTPAQAARFVGTIEGFTAGVSLEPSTALAIQTIRDGFAVKRAVRPKPVVSFPEVDQRRTERRIFDRRSMDDVLGQRAKVCDRRKLTGEPVSIMGGL